jgi:tryptophan synthase alpha chain
MKHNRALILERRIKHLKASGRVPLIPYITCWDPDLETTEKILWEIAEEGPACIELGFPFSDPVADGPTIQKAVVRALKHRPTLEEFFEFVSSLQKKGFSVPLLCMTYYNILFRYGLERVVRDSVESGLTGFIVPDLPVEEAKPWLSATRSSGLATVFLATPTSSEARIKRISRVSRGFLYYVSVTGITGVRDKLPQDLTQRLELVRRISRIPVAVGFGISSPEHIKLLMPYADALVVGSALVRVVEKEGRNSPQAVRALVKRLIQYEAS